MTRRISPTNLNCNLLPFAAESPSCPGSHSHRGHVSRPWADWEFAGKATGSGMIFHSIAAEYYY